MILNVVDFLFGCSHKNYSFPITIKSKGNQRRPEAASVTGTYVVCTDCGKEFPYDWRQMKVVSMPGKHAGRQPVAAEALESVAGKAS